MDAATPERLIGRATGTGEPSAVVVLSFEQRVRTRYVTALEDGRPLVVAVPRGSVMRGAEHWVTASGLVVAVLAARESLLEVTSDDPLLLARAAYHLGNRHVAVEIAAGRIRIAHDPVLGRLLEGLGLQPYALVGAFEPEGGAYGHDHAHAGGGHALAPVLHEYRSV
ncbi:MAG: urease accessory protein UreE [Pseudomonadota bacterium]|jgi:urease accessory protein